MNICLSFKLGRVILNHICFYFVFVCSSSVVSVALLRIMGRDVAELPLVATLGDAQGFVSTEFRRSSNLVVCWYCCQFAMPVLYHLTIRYSIVSCTLLCTLLRYIWH
jgi:hypothetical protein